MAATQISSAQRVAASASRVAPKAAAFFESPRVTVVGASFAARPIASSAQPFVGCQALSGRTGAKATRGQSQHSVVVAMAEGAKRALISVSDKSGLVDLAKGLLDQGFTLVSTGGTATAIAAAGLPVTKVEEITNFPEMLDGRVKTLHPSVHGGILARRGVRDHGEALKKHHIAPIDAVIVNLYPFVATVTAAAAPSFDQAVENIDIGGPTMIRAAAKNHEDVWVVVDPADYPDLLAAMAAPDAEANLQLRRRLAWKAFQHTASYDSAVSEWLWPHASGASPDSWQPPPRLTLPLRLSASLRYGENPHQRAAFYVDEALGERGKGGVATARQHHGKEMSYNNYLDADAAWQCVGEFDRPACVVVKHTNPCGVAVAVAQETDDDAGAAAGDAGAAAAGDAADASLLEAYRSAVRADPISAFGGIVAFNVTITEALASEIREFRSPVDGSTRMFYEIVVAPGYTAGGLATLKGKSKTLRILEAELTGKGRRSFRQIGGGWLLQDSDDLSADDLTLTCVTDRQPTEGEVEDAKFAWRCVKHVKSNAITVAKSFRLLGMGSGQPNRVQSCAIALEKAGHEAKGAALASDAFFPFAWNDGVEAACQAGVSVIIQPGGSVRDQDAIDCCNKYNVAMLFTNVRHFRH